MRSLLSDTRCPVCRHSSDKIFVVSDQSIDYENLSKQMWGDVGPKGFEQDFKTGMFVQDATEMIRLTNFRKLICRFCFCEIKSIEKFRYHMIQSHGVFFCELCMNHNKMFPAEQTLYNDTALTQHKESVHIKCQLCPQFLYDDRELLKHIREKHYFCELCPIEVRPAFGDYETIEKHYRQAHYLCEVEMCRETRHIVFMTYEDLRDHYRELHPSLQPAISVGFRFNDEPDKFVPAINDTSEKTFSVPSMNREERDSNFPALAPAPPEPTVPSYNKKQKPKPNNNDFPALSLSKSPNDVQRVDYSNSSLSKQKAPKAKVYVANPVPNPLLPAPKVNPNQPVHPISLKPIEEQKQSPPKKKAKEDSKQSNRLLEEITKLNKREATPEDFLTFCNEESINVDSQFISLLRANIVSNSLCEKLIHILQNTGYRPKARKEPEETKVIPQKNNQKGNEKAKNNGSSLIEFPSLVNEPNAKAAEDHYSKTLTANVVILNNNLINTKLFVKSMLEFVPRNEINEAKNIIREKVKNQAKLQEIFQLLETELQSLHYESEYPSLLTPKPPAPKPVTQNFIVEIKEKLKLYNEGTISEKEFVNACYEIIPRNQLNQAVIEIRNAIEDEVKREKIVKGIERKVSTKSYDEDFPTLKVVRLPPQKQPKNKKNNN
mmetsp:Transcript_4089/g.3943  ORF Transcript_4089/g.3943 Transcript_4089/m.3943 type:complete len:661 (-) Transcript_4089:8-1990(-)